MQAHKIIAVLPSSLAADDSEKREGGQYRRVTGRRHARVITIAVPITQT